MNITINLTEAQEYEIYHKVKRQLLKEDAVYHIREFIEYETFDTNGDEDFFKNFDYDAVDYDYLVDEFIAHDDAGICANELWDNIIGEYLSEMTME